MGKEKLLEQLSLTELKDLAKKNKINLEVSTWLGFSSKRASTKEEYIDTLSRSSKISYAFLKNYTEKKQHAAGGFKKSTLSNIRILIEKFWKPSINLKSERAYQQHLFLFLRENLGAEKVVKERGKENPDLVVDGRIPIELKYNFSMGGRDRADGQLRRYSKTYSQKPIFLLCGIKRDNVWAEWNKTYAKSHKHKVITILKFGVREL